MADISSFLLAIKNAIYGEDVRNSIYNAINAINNENSTMQSSITNTVQNTLNELRVYEQVNALPEVGDSKILYAVSDITYDWVDTNNSNYEDWEELTDTPYIQVPMNESVIDDVNANAVKPVMARYYIVGSNCTVNIKNSSETRSATIKTIYLTETSLTATGQDYNGITKQQTFDNISLDRAEITVSRQPGEQWPSLLGSVGWGTITLQYMEFIYDANDRLWKFNNEGTYVSRTMNFEYYRDTSSEAVKYIQILRYNINSSLLGDVLFCRNYKAYKEQFIDRTVEPPVNRCRHLRIIHRGYTADWYGEMPETISRIAEVEYDSNGYETASHSAGLVTSIQDLFYWESGEATYVDGTPKNWKVPMSTGTSATLWFWSDVIRRYISISGAIDPSTVRPTGYSKTIATSDWGNDTALVTGINFVSGKSYMIAVSPDTSSKTTYNNSNIYCESISLDPSGLIFKKNEQTIYSDVVVNIVVQEINGQTVINNE